MQRQAETTRRPESAGEVTHGQLAALRGKYLTVLELRRARESLEARGILRFEGDALTARRARCRDLARDFPGTLRELDVLDAPTLAGRLQTVERLLAGEGEDVPLWLRAVSGFHARARAVLAVRRWLASRRAGAAPGADEWTAPLRAWLEGRPERDGLVAVCGGVDTACLEQILRPPGGRLMSLVWESLAKDLGRSAGELQRAIYGPFEA